jgi:hypothetical protein
MKVDYIVGAGNVGATCAMISYRGIAEGSVA